MMTTSLRLAELMAARIFHDLGSPMASMTAILPQAMDPEARSILMETAAELRARMKLFSAAFGNTDELDWTEAGALLLGAPMAHRVRFELAPSPRILTPGEARLLLSAALLAAEALPRGGLVRITRDAEARITILPEGRDATWSPTLLALLAGESLEAALAEGPRRVLAPWVVAQAAAEGQELSLALATGLALPALLITPAD